MGVCRNLTIRVLSNLKCFTDILKLLINEGFDFGADGKIVSLSEDDIERFDYIEYDSFEKVNNVIERREQKGYSNHIVIWDKQNEDSLLLNISKTKSEYKGFTNQYTINFSIGYGVRIKDAERYTDFGVYLNRLIPIFVKNSMYVCQIDCCDFDS